MLGLSRQEHDALAPSERTARLATAREAMLAAGAHVVVESVADVPRLLSTLAGTP
jgi:phosphonoacetaldehyde hydrolase